MNQIVSILKVLRLNRRHYTTILLVIILSSALLTYLTARYEITASVHKPLAPLAYTTFSILFLWAVLISILVFDQHLRIGTRRGITLILTGVGCVITLVIVYAFQTNPDSIWRFPSTELGVLIFRLISLPVSTLHMFLVLPGIDIPIYLGLLVSVPALLLTWVLLIDALLRRMKPVKTESVQMRTAEGPSRSFLTGRFEERILLLSSVIVAILIRAIPFVLGDMPTGFDTAYYIGTLQGSPKLRWPETAWHRDTPIAYLILTVIGAVLQITRPLPASQVKFVELIPVAFHAVSVLAAYSLAKKATMNARSAALASLFASSAFSQLRMSFDLYKNILGISVLAFSLEAYLLLIQRRTGRYFVASLILLCVLLGIHPYPALILILTLSTYALSDYLLQPKTGEENKAVSTTLILFLATGIILAPLTLRFLTESPLIDDPWPHEPTTPIFRMPVFTQEGREFLLLTVGAVGFIHCILNRDSKAKTLFSIWLLVTVVLAEQTIFQVFFEAEESEKVPRFIWHLSYPNSILGAIGITQANKRLNNKNKISTESEHSPKPEMQKSIFIPVIISLILLLHTWNAITYMSDYGPMMERSNYTAMVWLDSRSIESSGLDSLYPQHMKQYVWQTHLKAPWETGIIRDIFYLRIYESEEHDLRTDFDRVYDAGEVQLYRGSTFSVSSEQPTQHLRAE